MAVAKRTGFLDFLMKLFLGPGDDNPKRRRDEYLFVFCGESGSGKSTAIPKIFPGLQPIPHTDEGQTNVFNIWQPRAPPRSRSAKSAPPWIVLEALGLLGNNSAQLDAGIVRKLERKIDELGPIRIPTVVFVTAPLDNNRFEGPQSEFSKTVRLLSQVKHLTDHNCSNVVLLLTRANMLSPDVNKQDKAARYVKAFRKAFPSKNSKIPYIIMGENTETGNTSMDVIKIYSALQLTQGDATILRHHDLPDERNMFYRIHFNRWTYDHEQSRVAESRYSTLLDEASSATEPLDCFAYSCWKASIDASQYGLESSYQHSFFSGKTQIVLADGRACLVQNCLVGDKVHGPHDKVGVITKIVKVKPRYGGKHLNVGCMLVKIGGRDDYGLFSGFRNPCRIRPIRSLKVMKGGNKPKFLYHVEVDGGEGTFYAGWRLVASRFRKGENHLKRCATINPTTT